MTDTTRTHPFKTIAKIILYPFAFVLISLFEFLKWLMIRLYNLIGHLADLLDKLVKKVHKFITWLRTKLFALISKLYDVFKTILRPFKRVLDFLFNPLIRLIRWLIHIVKPLWHKMIDSLIRFIYFCRRQWLKFFSPIYRFLKNVYHFIVDIFSKIYNPTVRFLTRVFTPINDLIKKLLLKTLDLTIVFIRKIIKPPLVQVYRSVKRVQQFIMSKFQANNLTETTKKE